MLENLENLENRIKLRFSSTKLVQTFVFCQSALLLLSIIIII